MSVPKGVIFDLDQTLVDSSIAEAERKSRNWKGVYKLIPQFKIYEGILETIESIKNQNIQICILTSSPSVYCEKVLDYFQLSCGQKVCYHDTRKHKPDPEPFEKALSLMRLDAKEVFAFGDKIEDSVGASRTGIDNALCVWGIDEYKKESELGTHAKFVLIEPSKILGCLQL